MLIIVGKILLYLVVICYSFGYVGFYLNYGVDAGNEQFCNEEVDDFIISIVKYELSNNLFYFYFIF